MTDIERGPLEPQREVGRNSLVNPDQFRQNLKHYRPVLGLRTAFDGSLEYFMYRVRERVFLQQQGVLVIVAGPVGSTKDWLTEHVVMHGFNLITHLNLPGVLSIDEYYTAWDIEEIRLKEILYAAKKVFSDNGPDWLPGMTRDEKLFSLFTTDRNYLLRQKADNPTGKRLIEFMDWVEIVTHDRHGQPGAGITHLEITPPDNLQIADYVKKAGDLLQLEVIEGQPFPMEFEQAVYSHVIHRVKQPFKLAREQTNPKSTYEFAVLNKTGATAHHELTIDNTGRTTISIVTSGRAYGEEHIFAIVRDPDFEDAAKFHLTPVAGVGLAYFLDYRDLLQQIPEDLDIANELAALYGIEPYITLEQLRQARVGGSSEQVKYAWQKTFEAYERDLHYLQQNFPEKVPEIIPAPGVEMILNTISTWKKYRPEVDMYDELMTSKHLLDQQLIDMIEKAFLVGRLIGRDPVEILENAMKMHRVGYQLEWVAREAAWENHMTVLADPAIPLTARQRQRFPQNRKKFIDKYITRKEAERT